ncbi:hypothetical protein, partial [Enterococcus faecium]|uniref:hypothetical protein n=1 Tax=Enterococcus faecium TaxID=1352 RepID=UPI003F51DF60
TGTFANGAQAVFSGQYVHSDGRTSYSKYQNYNLFGKVVVPVGPDVKLTFIATYNKNRFNQIALTGKWDVNDTLGFDGHVGY